MFKALKFDPSTSLRIGFLVLLGLCSAQVSWWMGENTVFSHRIKAHLISLFEKNAEVVNASASGQLETLSLPDHLIYNAENGLIEVNPSAIEEVTNRYDKRITRYYWEGGFFLFVLIACMSFLTTAIRQDAALRRRQRNFLASVSHEFKSPLASIQLAADTLRRRSQEAETQRWVPRIQQDCVRLLRTVENILNSARIEDGKLSVNNQDVKIADIVNSIADEMGARLQSEDIDIVINDFSGTLVQTDPTAAETILRNLIDNAVKACSTGKGNKISITGESSNDKFTLEVEDNGMGFPPEDAKLIFEKFYRVGDELQRKTPGTGLGLYITRQLAERCGAQISAESNGPGTGALFHVSWKLST